MNSKFYLYGVISSYEGEDAITSKNIRDFLNGASSDIVDIHINSPGGSVFEAIAIYNILKQSNKTVNIYIDSLAASAASFIAMAGNQIFMAQNAMFMIHRALTGIIGNSTDLREMADFLDRINEIIIKMYQDRFKGSEKELRQFFNDETYFTAGECLKYGFIDNIVNGGKAVTQTEAQNMYKEASKLVASADYSKIEKYIEKRNAPAASTSLDKDLGITPDEAIKAVKAMNALNTAGIDTSNLNPKELAIAYDNLPSESINPSQISNEEQEIDRILDNLYGPAKANKHVSSLIHNVPKKTGISDEEELDRFLDKIFGPKEANQQNLTINTDINSSTEQELDALLDKLFKK